MTKVVKKSVKKAGKKVSARAVPVRSRSVLVRFAAVLLPAGMLVLAFSFAASLLWSSPLVARAATTTLFSDDFESSGFSNWTSGNPDHPRWDVTPNGHNDSQSAEVKGSTDSSITKELSTTGLQNIVLDFWFRATHLEGTDEEQNDQVAPEYSIDGEETWIAMPGLFTIDDDVDTNEWVHESFTLPANADNQNDLTLRFHALLGNGSDKVWLDDINLSGSDIPPAAPDCSGEIPSDLEVNVTQSVTNDPDSGFHGNWALDNFTRSIKVWNSNVEGYHCAQADDAGTFLTTGPLGPQVGDALAVGIAGTMTGGTGRMVIHGTFTPAEGWSTTGTAPAQDCSVTGTCEEGLTHKWVNHYFTVNEGEVVYEYPNWGWTYTSCGHSSWTNAAAGSTGDIVSGPTDEVCVVPPPTCTVSQHLEENVCVENPAPEQTNNGGGSSNNNGGGGIVGSGPLSLGFVTTNAGGGNGGFVLGTSTEASSDDLPAGCSAYLGSYLHMGGKSNTSDEVKKLQIFLNTHMNANLPVTGIFGTMTFEAVKKFQLANWEKVLKPWVAFGLKSDHTPTGYVYKTTKHTINLLSCADLAEPAPQLP